MRQLCENCVECYKKPGMGCGVWGVGDGEQTLVAGCERKKDFPIPYPLHPPERVAAVPTLNEVGWGRIAGNLRNENFQ